MKKILLFLLTAVLVAAFVACDRDRDTSEGVIVDTAPTTADVVTDNATDGATESPTDAASEAVASVPDFRVLDAEGNTVALSDCFGRPIVINFWATWCGPCKAELPEFEEAYKTYGDRVQFLMVDLTDGVSDTVEVVQSFVAAMGYTFPVYFDVNGEALNAYSIQSIPATYFISETGELVTYAIGAISGELLEKGIGMILPTD